MSNPKLKGCEIMANEDIRAYAKKRGIYLWQIAKALEKSEATFNRMLRFEFTAVEKNRIICIIDILSSASSEKN